MNNMQHMWDIVVRSVKTALAAYASFVVAGGFNIIHVNSTVEVKVAALAAFLTALLNLGLTIHKDVLNSLATPVVPVEVVPTEVVSPSATPLE